jgi:radical SAM protein with 4Fe4S-binding SPASM domain
MSGLYRVDRAEKEAFLRKLESRQEVHEFPPQVVIETTAACNLSCSHCGHGVMTRRKGHMSMPLFRKIVDEVAERAPHTEVWPTFYGEAFLLEYRLFYMLEYAKKRNLTNLVLNTNGTRFTAEVAEWVIESGLDVIIFSLDGFSAPVFESIRVGARRDEVFRNVERLLEIKARQGVSHPRVEVQYSLMDSNDHEVDAFREYWVARGADVKVREKLTWTGVVAAPNLGTSLHRIACPWALRTCAIHWNGDVVACAVDYDGRYVAGNVSHNSIADIWNGPHRALQRLHLAHDFRHLPAPCRDCLDWQVAGGAEHFTSEGLRR